MKALILIQDELVNKVNFNNVSSGDIGDGQASKKPEDRLIVLCIAYHNIAVE